MDEYDQNIPDNIDMNKKEFMKRLEELIRDFNLTLNEISKATGVPKSNIHSWINGSAPNLFQLAKVSEYLGISLDELVFGRSTIETIHGDYIVRIIKRIK